MTIYIIIGVFVFLFILKSLLSHNISIADAVEKLNNGAVLIDVRTPEEFASGAHKGAINIPVDDLGRIGDHVPDKNNAVLLYCQSGMRATSACSTLRHTGYSDVHNIGSYSRAGKVVS